MAANESKVIFAAGQELVLYDLQTRQNESLVSTGHVSGNQHIYPLSEILMLSNGKKLFCLRWRIFIPMIKLSILFKRFDMVYPSFVCDDLSLHTLNAGCIVIGSYFHSHIF